MSPVDTTTPTVNQDTNNTAKTSKPGLRIMGRRVTYPVIRGKQLSHIHMVAFMLIFAAIGTFLVYFSHAATAPLATVQAEQLALPAGASVVSDSTASAGKALRFTANGIASSTAAFSLSTPATSLVVRAKGVQCSGAPKVVVKVGDTASAISTTVLTSAVTTTGWADYTATVALPAGSHYLSVGFAEDYTQYKKGNGRLVCSRELTVDKVDLFGPGDSSILSINDNTLGAGSNQFEYVGNWTYATSATAPNLAASYSGDEHYTSTTGAYYQVRFNGTQAKIYATTDAHHGIAGVSIDGGSETMVDLYAASRTSGVLIYTSPVLSDSAHTLKVRATGAKNAASTGTVIVADKVDINASSTPPPPTVIITIPSAGAYVSGGIPVSATASSSTSSIAKVEFSIDGTLNTTDTSSPFCMAEPNVSPCTNWDSKTISDGSHTITAYSYDANGLKSLASTVSFNVSNATVSGSTFPTLITKGNRIVTATTGQDVILRGANIMESEWKNGYCSSGYYADANGLACDATPIAMAWEDKAVPVLADTWKANIMVHGFASDPINQNNAAYLSIMDYYVKLATAKRMYMVFSWRSYQQNDCQPTKPDTGAYTRPSAHGSCVGTGATQALATLAKRYKDDPHVIISLQVEPHDVPWSTLRPIFENMIDQIRAATSPKVSLIMVPGTGYSRDISGAITDPVSRTNIVYKTHPYTHSANFSNDFLNTYLAGYPVFIGEFGPTAYMTMDDVNALLNLANQQKLGWAAWSFEFDANPALVCWQDKDPTKPCYMSIEPTDPFGIAVKNAMILTPPVPN